LEVGGSSSVTVSASGAVVPDANDGATLGTAALGFADVFLADGSTIQFGNDEEITLTHVADVGLTLTHVTAGDNLPIVLQLKSEEDAIIANEVIASIEFAAGDSDGTDGATVAAGIHAIAEGTFAADANATKLVFTTGVSETAAASATAKMTLSSAGLLTIADDIMIKDGGTIGVASTNDALTISSAGLLTVKDDLVIKTGGTIGGANDTDLLTLTSAVLTVAGQVVGTGFTGTLDGVLGSGTAAAATTTTLASTTITASGIIKTDDSTAATSTTDGSLQTDGGLSVALDAVIGDDLILLSDAAVIKFGANSEVTLTHVHNAGLILGGTLPSLTIGDAGAEDTKIVFDGNAQDYHIGLDDSADDLVIGLGAALGTTPAISINEDLVSTFGGATVGKLFTDATNTGDITLDFTANQNFLLTFTGNVELQNPTTENVGQSGFIIIIQDGTGSRTLSFEGDFETAGGAGITLSTAANSVDVIPYVVKAANSIQLGAVQLAFS